MYQREIILLVSRVSSIRAFAKKYSSAIVRSPAANRTTVIRPSKCYIKSYLYKRSACVVGCHLGAICVCHHDYYYYYYIVIKNVCHACVRMGETES